MYYSDQTTASGGTASTTTYTTSESSSTAETAPAEITVTGDTNAVIPLYKEDLAVGKRDVDAGSVRVKKVVKTETVNQPIELRHEEIEIERIPAGSETAGAPSGNAFQDQDTVIHLSKEEAVVEKRVASAGQVVLKAHSSSTQSNISAQVRSEDVAVTKSGNYGDNVTINGNIQQSGAMGGAESPSGQTMGASSSGTITDPTTLSSGSPSDLSGRSVQFSNLKVKSVMGDHVACLDAGNGQSLYVYSAKGGSGLSAGDWVNVKGTVKTSASDLTGSALQVLSSQSAYIDAQKIEKAP
jgi:uncharacterized protein (TIGR02271 family)